MPTGMKSLGWSASHRDGSSSLTLDKDRTVTAKSTKHAIPVPKTAEYRTTLTPAEFDEVAATIGRQRGLCEAAPKRKGVPDEGRPTLELVLESRTCKVTLWDNEWHDRFPEVESLTTRLWRKAVADSK